MLKVGVLGIGHLGKFHLNNWLVIEGVEVVGFFDPGDNNALAVVEKYKTVLQSIGGKVHEVKDVAAIIEIMRQQFEDAVRILSVIDSFSGYAEMYTQGDDPHKLDNVDVAIINAHFGVAENGAVWVTEHLLQERVLPLLMHKILWPPCR